MSEQWEKWAVRLHTGGEAGYTEEYTALYKELVCDYLFQLGFN